MKSGIATAISTSTKKGVKKTNQAKGLLIPEHGLEGDAHAGYGHRQVSLLASESIAKMKAKGLEVGPGDFAENITTSGLDLSKLSIGNRLCIGKDVLIEITQIGKECHERCAIYFQAGDCVMPKEGIFAKVINGGEIRVGDTIHIV